MIAVWVLSHWRLAFGLAVAIVLAGYIAVLKGELRYESGQLADSKVEIGKLREAVGERDAALARQNFAVLQMKLQADKEARQRSSAEAIANKLRTLGKSQVQGILDQTVSNSCEGALKWLNQEAVQLSVW